MSRHSQKPLNPAKNGPAFTAREQGRPIQPHSFSKTVRDPVMKFLSHIRSRSKLKNDTSEASIYDIRGSSSAGPYGNRSPITKLPNNVLEQIFAYVCPHVRDYTYNGLEDSMQDGDCMLCDLRELAQCALMRRQWADVVQKLLYRSVRIDPVHYCQREIDLAEKRKRKSFFNSNGEPKDAPTERLKLFSRTVRENQYLASQVLFLKLPYMTRESCKPDLARAVSALPNLRYVDLPEGVYVDEPASNTLKTELQSRCPDIRKMRYAAGSERSFAKLSQSRYWQSLEILEVSHLAVEPSVLLYSLASFPALHELRLEGISLLDDSVFQSGLQNLAIPPLKKLHLEDARNVSIDGILPYLCRPETREVITHLTLINTGLELQLLYKIFAAAPYLQTAHISETVSRGLPASVPPLVSTSITSFHYEISNPSNTKQLPHMIRAPAESYYDYLASSLLQRSLPALDELFVLSTSFPDLLMLPPAAPFAESPNKSASKGLAHPLRLYTKAMNEFEWQITHISPPTAANRRGSATKTRPVSLYGNSHQLGPQWGDRARDSVMVGNGFGGFLAIPSEDALPNTSMHSKKKSKDYGWMG